MLGLGATITSSAVILSTALNTYISDFTSDIDGWVDYNITVGNQTKTANQSIGGRSGVLRLTYDADETSGQFGIKLDSGETFTVGDTYEATFDIYTIDVDPQDGAASVSAYIQTGIGYNGTRRTSAVAPHDTWTTIATTGIVEITGGSNSSYLLIAFTPTANAPGVGDSIYLDNIIVTHYRA